MTALRVLSEHLLLLGLLVCRIAFLVFGLAVLGTTFALGGFLKTESPSPAILAAWGWIRATGGLFVAAAVLLFVVRDWLHIPRSDSSDSPKAPGWLVLTGLCLAAQVVVAILFSAGIRSLWQDVIPALDQAGVFREARSQAGAMMLAPVLAVLFVPLLEAAAAVSLIAAPLLLLVLLFTRSRAFPKSLVLTAIVQGALVAGSLLAMRAFIPMAQMLLSASARVTDMPLEIRQALAGLRRIAELIGPTAHDFAFLLVPIAVWIPFMMFSRRMGATFRAGSFERERVGERGRSDPGEAALSSPASII